jgi:hypothetical protein
MYENKYGMLINTKLLLSKFGVPVGNKIYKYISPEVLSSALKEEGSVSIKFSLPKDYNDPFELFLALDASETEPELLAFYRDIVQVIPQRPTTCFSRSPVVTPMWAHYASNLTGFVLEFDEDILMEFLSNSYIKDVSYIEKTSAEIEGHLQRAYYVGKPRHAMWLRQATDHHAYFSKHICWNYEQERRLVINTDDIDKLDEHMLIYVPTKCITAIIAGSRVSENMLKESITQAVNIGCKHYSLLIGKSYSHAFLKDESGVSYILSDDGIVEEAISRCESCKEPIEDESQELCGWCAIDNIHIEDAMVRNPLRMLQRYVDLEQYADSFNATRKK